MKNQMNKITLAIAAAALFASSTAFANPTLDNSMVAVNVSHAGIVTQDVVFRAASAQGVCFGRWEWVNGRFRCVGIYVE